MSEREYSLPFNNISWGPFLQELDITGVLQAIASTNTNPGSSHKEERTKHLLFTSSERQDLQTQRLN